MTVKGRKKNCSNCGAQFEESKAESNKQWDKRSYCSMKCNNSSKNRIVSIFDRLEKFQVKNDRGCWGWSGCKDNKGYPQLSSRNGSLGSPEKAHRVSYEKEYGEIPEGMNVCHKCDNPECTRPDHLFIGTQKDNMVDCSSKGRLSPKSLLNLIPGSAGYCGAATKNNKVVK